MHNLVSDNYKALFPQTQCLIHGPEKDKKHRLTATIMSIRQRKSIQRNKAERRGKKKKKHTESGKRPIEIDKETDELG